MVEVSVLIPAFNAGGSIRPALESVRRQTHTAWHCVVSDDGSTDDTRELVMRYVRADSRFELYPGPHAGIVASLNRGLSFCRGKYIARFDADDLMHPERLRMQVEAMEHDDGLAGVGCLVRTFPRSGMTAGRRDYERWLNGLVCEQLVFRDRFVECPLAHPTLLLRGTVLREFGYRAMQWPEDYDLVLRLLGAGCRLSTVPRRLLHWRDGATRLSRRSSDYAIESFTRCKAHFLARDWLEASEYVLWGYGSTGRNLARALTEHGKRPSFIVEVHPGRIGQRIQSAPVLSVEGFSNLDRRGTRIIVSVAGLGPRTDARGLAASLGLVEGEDYVCAA